MQLHPKLRQRYFERVGDLNPVKPDRLQTWLMSAIIRRF